MSSQTKQITVRMPVEILNKLDGMSEKNHRSLAGEIIHASALYIAAQGTPSPEEYYQFLHFLEWTKAKILDNMPQNDQKKAGWVKVKEGWID